MKISNVKTFLVLQIVLFINSFGGIFSKLAAGQPFLSARFCLCYGAMLMILFFYAIAWQQIIKRMPLTTAYASKAVMVVWGIVWGTLFFHESITAGKAAGAALIIAGIVLFFTGGGERDRG